MSNENQRGFGETDESIQQILDKAQALLGESCNGYIIIMEVETNDGNISTPMAWGGGINRAIGLAHRAKRRLDGLDDCEMSRD